VSNSSDQDTDYESARFDRVLGTLTGLPGHKVTRPATIMQTVPIINATTTAVVQTMRTDEDGMLIFLQVVHGYETTRLVLPDKVAQAIYRQRDALMDRSTPESRRRAKVKRDREKARAERAARSAAWRAKHPDGGPLAQARK
jgi:hypothetical protein